MNIDTFNISITSSILLIVNSLFLAISFLSWFIPIKRQHLFKTFFAIISIFSGIAFLVINVIKQAKANFIAECVILNEKFYQADFYYNHLFDELFTKHLQTFISDPRIMLLGVDKAILESYVLSLYMELNNTANLTKYFETLTNNWFKDNYEVFVQFFCDIWPSSFLDLTLLYLKEFHWISEIFLVDVVLAFDIMFFSYITFNNMHCFILKYKKYVKNKEL